MKRKFPWRPNQVYIIPTGFGLIYGASLILLLGMAYTYNNNLTYALTFFLSSFGFSSMIATQRHVKRLDPRPRVGSLNTAGDRITPPLEIEDDPDGFRVDLRPRDLAPGVIELEGREWHLLRRGLHPISLVEARSRFPSGLFVAWKRVPVPLVLTVAPRPYDHGLGPRPAPWAGDPSRQNAIAADFGELSHSENARPEDPSSRIDWKALARGRGLRRKDFEDGSAEIRLLRWQDTESLVDDERRLEQLSFWFRQALLDRKRVTVELPDGRRSSMREDILRSLAQWAPQSERPS